MTLTYEQVVGSLDVYAEIQGEQAAQFEKNLHALEDAVSYGAVDPNQPEAVEMLRYYWTVLHERHYGMQIGFEKSANLVREMEGAS